ncbi:hypothetical protein ABPG74_010900 [Tetrahymena malaccensis]
MGNSTNIINNQQNIQQLLVDFKLEQGRQRTALISRQFQLFDQYYNGFQSNNIDQNQLPISDRQVNQLIQKYLRSKRFKNIQYVARGCQGRVFFGYDDLNIKYAFKCYEKQPIQQAIDQNIQQAQAEINMLQRFTNKDFVIKYINKFDDNQDFVVIQLQACLTNLEKILERETILSENTIIKFAYEIFMGICNIHTENVIIFDLKPENILIDYCGKAAVSDFGFSRQLQQNLSTVSQQNGNLLYKAPEGIELNQNLYEQNFQDYQFNPNRLSKKADLFSFALILYRMLTDKQTIFQRCQNQNYDIDISNLDRELKYKDELNFIIKGLTKLHPKQRIDHYQVLLTLQKIYFQESKQEEQGLRKEFLDKNLKFKDIQYFVSGDKDHVIPIYKIKDQKKQSNIFFQIFQMATILILVILTQQYFTLEKRSM